MSENSLPSELPDWISEHIKLYLENPEQAHNWDSTSAGGPGVLPALLLITTGRKSGKTRMLPLIYARVDEGFVIIASKGGAPSHPAWYLNLVKQPDCEVYVGSDQYRVQARTSEGEERGVLWKKMAEIYPPYDDYQAATERQIPVVVLEPVL